MTLVNIQRSATDQATQQAALVLLRAHAAVACSEKRQPWQLEGGDLENSAGGPTSKEGRAFIMDLVLEESAGCALAVSLSAPPTHFHLKTHTDVGCMDPTQEKLTTKTHTCPCMSLQKPVGRPCTRRARLHWWVRPFARISAPSLSPSSSCSPPSQRVSITTFPCRRSEVIGLS